MKEEEIIRESIEQFLRQELNPDQVKAVSAKIRDLDSWQKIHQKVLLESQGIRLNQLKKIKSTLNKLETSPDHIKNLFKTEGYLKPIGAYNEEAYDSEITKREIGYQLGPDQSMLQGIRYSNLRSKLTSLKEQEKIWLGNQENKSKPTKVISLKKYGWAAAVSLLLIISIYFLYNKKPVYNNAYLLEHFNEYLLHDKTRSAAVEEKLDKDKEIGYDLYVLKEFKEAIPYLNRRWEKQQDSTALFYLAVSYAGIGEFEKSEKLIDQLNNFSNKEIILKKLIK